MDRKTFIYQNLTGGAGLLLGLLSGFNLSRDIKFQPSTFYKAPGLYYKRQTLPNLGSHSHLHKIIGSEEYDILARKKSVIKFGNPSTFGGQV